MSSTYGEYLRLSIFGQSHSAAIGMVLDGIPAGLAVDLQQLKQFLSRRAPGKNDWSTTRAEADEPEFLGGILDCHTCGSPIAAVIRNNNTRSADYTAFSDCPRPGHADYTAQIKYGGFQDRAGGGHFSGRLTAPLCVAGGLCLQWLHGQGIEINAHIARIMELSDTPFDPIDTAPLSLCPDFPTLNDEAGKKMRQRIAQAAQQGDSVGGVIECRVTGLPAGLGEPMFGGAESKIAQILYGIPAVKGVEFGLGFAVADCTGSQCNDPFIHSDTALATATNHCGGILGGITDGMPVLFRVAFKPTPSIAMPQQTANLRTGEQTELRIAGRHDPCIVPRAVPVVEAAAAIAIYDLILGNTQVG